MIGIFSDPNTSHVRGPQKVFLNLIKGLDLIKIDYTINRVSNFNCCLNNHRRFWSNLPENTMMGPNLVVNPPDDVELFHKFKNILVPSSMVMDNYKKFDETNSTKFFVHATGIDTDMWDVNKNINRDCLIYFKNRNEQELEKLKEILDGKNITYYVLKYGSYYEEQLKEILTKVKFTILLTNTESQGIGYMEILSTNTPCFVYNKIYDDGKLRGLSTPYFNEECGIIYDNDIIGSDKKLTEFIDKLNEFNPRNYIINNFTLIKSAKTLIEKLYEI